MNFWRIPGFVLALVRGIIILLLIPILVIGYLIASSIFFKHTPARAYKLRRFFIRIATPILGIKIETEGAPIEGTALYLSNHRSFSDPVILCGVLDAYVIAKAEVADYPFLNKGAELTGIIYVKRDDVNSRKATRHAMVETIQKGLNVLVYPEGTTNASKRTLPYRMGTFKEAAANNIPIVPVTLEYKTKYDLWLNRGLFAQFFYQFWKWSTPVKLKFGEVHQSDDFEYLQKVCEDWTNASIEELHKGWGSTFDY